MAYTASITILTVISIERYMAIIHPMKSKQVGVLQRVMYHVNIEYQSTLFIPSRATTKKVAELNFTLNIGSLKLRLIV